MDCAGSIVKYYDTIPETISNPELIGISTLMNTKAILFMDSFQNSLTNLKA